MNYPEREDLKMAAQKAAMNKTTVPIDPQTLLGLLYAVDIAEEEQMRLEDEKDYEIEKLEDELTKALEEIDGMADELLMLREHAEVLGESKARA